CFWLFTNRSGRQHHLSSDLLLYGKTHTLSPTIGAEMRLFKYVLMCSTDFTSAIAINKHLMQRAVSAKYNELLHLINV
ncbi:MAG: hypothetical protein WBM78_17570, partial [Desulfobacterales bacterium]